MIGENGAVVIKRRVEVKRFDAGDGECEHWFRPSDESHCGHYLGTTVSEEEERFEVHGG